MIVVKDLNYKYPNEQKYLLTELSFSLKKGSFTTLVGPIGSGKSTLIKILLGFLKVEQQIKIDDLVLCSRNIKEIRSKIGVVLEHPEDTFVAQTVINEIAFGLEVQNKTKKEIKERIKEVTSTLGIESLLNRDLNHLSRGEKQLVSLASILVMNPIILILDGSLSMVDELEKKRIMKILTKMSQKQNLTILNVTHDLNESLYGQDILLLQNGKIILQGNKEDVLKEEAILKKAGLQLPFLADLSIRLMYYGILDHIILDMDEMVDTIWK